MSAESDGSVVVKTESLLAKMSAVAAYRPTLAQLFGGARAIVPYTTYAVQRLGRVGIVGVALFVFSAVAFLATNAPLREQLLSDTAALEQVTSNTATSDVAVSSTPQAQYDGFLQELPTRDDLPALMGQIVAVSAQQGVELEEGKYELVSTANAGHIARYRMGFPVTGSYPQIRGFIDNALVAVPSMSLDGLRVQRKDVGLGLVSAELDFAVFVRTGL